MNERNFTKISQLAQSITLQAGKRIAEIRLSHSYEIGYKSERNLVTSADIEAQDLIISGIKKVFPDHQFLAEENLDKSTGQALSKGPWWIIDPIDGTVNYANNLNNVAVSVGFALDGVVELGAVYAPFLDEFYFANRGNGSTLNGKSIHALVESDPKKCLIATGFPYSRTETDLLSLRVKHVLDNFQDIRRFGAASIDICWVANGRLGGYFESVSPWDMAAASLIAKEAGAITGQYQKKSTEINSNSMPQDVEYSDLPPDLRSNNFLVASPNIFEKLKATLEL